MGKMTRYSAPEKVEGWGWFDLEIDQEEADSIFYGSTEQTLRGWTPELDFEDGELEPIEDKNGDYVLFGDAMKIIMWYKNKLKGRK